MVAFPYFCLIIYLIYYFKFKTKKPARGSLKAVPQIIHPITSSPPSFDLEPYAVEIPPLPSTKDSWLSVGGDTETLKGYARDLDRHSQDMANAANRAVNKFEQDYEKLKDQQLQIYRRIYQCRKLLKKFPELKQHKISASDIPEEFRIKVPSKPSCISSKDIEKRFSISSGVGRGAGRLINANGGVQNSQNILVAAAALATIAINGKANVSKLKRTLESTRGSILNYGTSLKTTTATLNEAHTELVNLSGKLKQSEVSLIEIINKVGTLDSKITRLEQAPPDIRKHLGTLYFLTLEAESYSKNRL